MSPDPYDINMDETVKREFDDYELPAVDKKSLNEIKKKLKNKGYKDIEEVEEHQEFLEDMTNRLKTVLQNERSLGKGNWELERQVDEIQALYFQLEQLRKEIEAAKKN
jgi:hypothetical protein